MFIVSHHFLVNCQDLSQQDTLTIHEFKSYVFFGLKAIVINIQKSIKNADMIMLEQFKSVMI